MKFRITSTVANGRIRADRLHLLIVFLLVIVFFVGAIPVGGVRLSGTMRSWDDEHGLNQADPQFLPLIFDHRVNPLEANDDSYQVFEDTIFHATTEENILNNDVLSSTLPVSVVLVQDVTHGQLVLLPDGRFSYAPSASYIGQDSFLYQLQDGVNQSNIAAVSLLVQPVNDAPVARNDEYEMQANTSLSVNESNGILANDEDPDSSTLQAVLASDVSDGALNLLSSGAFEYTPDADFSGLDSFEYWANDGELLSNLATVTITVTQANQPPRLVTGEVAFATTIIGTGVDEAHAVVAADFDGDGDMDAAATDYVDGLVLRYDNDGNEVFTESALDPNLEGAYPAHVDDVDQDGDVDIFAGGYLADTYVWYRNDGRGEFTNVYIDIAADGAHSLVTGDMDEDGHIDLVTADQDAGEIAWYENDGSNNFVRSSIDVAFTQAKRAEIADMNGDGNLDVVAAAFQLDEIAWYENDGDENFTKHTIYTDADGAYYVSSGDIDGDGDMDLFSASQNDNTIAWYENDGNENFTVHLLDTTMEGARSVIAADLDRDGDVDAVAAAVLSDVVIWYENDGSANFVRKVVDDTVNGPYGVFTIDMDRDGDTDVLSASKWSRDARFHAQYRMHTADVSRGGVLPIDTSLLQAMDDDDGPDAVIYTLTEPPDHGWLQLDSTDLVVNDTFTQADIDGSRMRYRHDGVGTATDRFDFTVQDGDVGNFKPAEGAFVLTITE